MAQFLLLDKDNKAINSIEWDGETPYTPPEGTSLVQYAGPFIPNAWWDGDKLVEKEEEQ